MKMYNQGGFVRISKLSARNRFNSGETVYLCPEKLRPGEPWNPEVSISKDESGPEFDVLVNSFEYYNCGASAGKRAMFFIKVGDENDG